MSNTMEPSTPMSDQPIAVRRSKRSTQQPDKYKPQDLYTQSTSKKKTKKK